MFGTVKGISPGKRLARGRRFSTIWFGSAAGVRADILGAAGGGGEAFAASGLGGFGMAGILGLA